MECKKWFKGAGPLLGMLSVQLIATGLQILSRVILSQGSFIFALMAYRHILAALCIAPFAFYLERNNQAKVTLVVVFWVFLSALTGIVMGMGMFYYGLRDTTATYATDFLNLIPIVTYIFSIVARMENLKFRTKRDKVRVIGTILCVAGALIVSLYKGKILHIGSHHPNHPALKIVNKMKPNWTRGSLLLVGSCFGYASWFIVQVKLLKAFPAKYWATMLTCVAAAVQTTVVGVCIDRRKSSWMLGWNLQLVTIVYSAVLASAASFYLISWAVASKGPTYPAMFNPLSLIFVAVIEAILLGEGLPVGSLLGVVVIIVGLYSFLWGGVREKSKDSPLPKSTSVKVELKRDSGLELASSATVVPTASPVSLSDDDEHSGS